MKFFCDSCNAKYSIADEKVRGKVVKVRCKRCDDIITVSDSKQQNQAESSSAQVGDVGSSPTRGAEQQWYYSVDGETFGPLPESQLVAKYRRGEVKDNSYVWKDAFADWKPATAVEPFRSTLRQSSGPSDDSKSRRKQTMGVGDAIESVEEADGPDDGRDQTGANRSPTSRSKRERNRSSERQARGGGDSGEDGRKERLDRLRNKLKSNFADSEAEQKDGGEESDEVESAEERSAVEPDAGRDDAEPEPNAELDAGDAEDLLEEPGPEAGTDGDEEFDAGFDDEDFGLGEEPAPEADEEPDEQESAEDLLTGDLGLSDAEPEQEDDDQLAAAADESSADEPDGPTLGAPGAAGPGGQPEGPPLGDSGAENIGDELEGSSDEATGSQAPDDDDDFELPPAGSTRLGDEASEDEAEAAAESESGLFDDVEEEEDDQAALPTAPKLSGEAEDKTAGSFADGVTESLLIQLDKIQDEGKGKRRLKIAAMVVLVIGCAGIWYYVWSTAPEDNELTVEPDPDRVVTEQDDDGPIEKTYSKDERQRILTVSPRKVEKVDEEAVKEAAESGGSGEAGGVEGGSAGGSQPAARGSAAPTNSGGSAGTKIARNDPAPSESRDDPQEDLLRRGVEESAGGGDDSFESAFEGAEKRSGDDDDDIERSMDDSETTDSASSEVGGSPSFDKSDEIASPRGLEGASANIEGAGGSEDESGGKQLPSKLTKDQIKAGVDTVRDTVGVCRQRQANRGVPVEAGKVYLTLHVQPSGRVTDFDVSPAKLEGSVFTECLHSRKRRWEFGKFDGSTQKLKTPFILQ
jgi:predicted Zn finger-like uncharacterized protein